MSSTGDTINFSIVSRFHYSWLVKGCCISGGKEQLSDIQVNGSLDSIVLHIDNNPNNGIYGFEVQFLLNEICNPCGIELVFVFGSIKNVQVVPLDDAIKRLPSEADTISDKFLEYVATADVKDILDIGGRARSGILYSGDYPGKTVTVIDILPGEGVDIVCDAHEMSNYLPHNHFDAIRCSAVFEHIIMPWKVAVEMNRVMRDGAVAFIRTHQTIGMHDMPWDYYRYSDTAYNGIFNKHTGFEIIATRLADPMFIVPFRWCERFSQVEKTAGFESSSVLVRKTGDAVLDWAITASDVVQNFYPE